MRVVHFFDILVEYVFALAFAACLVAGVFDWRYFVVAGLALLFYFIWGAWRLRCPWCGGAVELSDLCRGLRKSCHCPACGHEIVVVTRVNIKSPTTRRDQGEKPEK